MQSVRRPLAAVAIALTLPGCAAAPMVMDYFPDGGQAAEPRVWPAPPEQARLEYAGVLVGEDNFRRADGEPESIGPRLLRWIAGLGRGSAAPLRLVRPQSGLVDRNGRILVTDAGRRAIVVFDETAGVIDVWDAAGGQAFAAPVGIAERPDGSLLIADAELGEIIVLSPDGNFVGRFGGDVLQRPTGLVVDAASGTTWVADTGAHDVKRFDGDGKFLGVIGKRGDGDGEFNGPTHLDLAADTLYITDTLNARVQLLAASDARPIGSIGRRGLYVGNLVRPKGVTTDLDGNIYVVESYHDYLLVFDADGRFLLPLGGTGSGVGQFFLPAGAWSDNNNRVFVADMFNGRVVVFRYLGR